jgi:phosphatidylinositol alpha-mannosyltransferase
MQFVLGRLDRRIAVSHPALEFVTQYFDGPYDVIPNGIDLQNYGENIEPFPWANDGTPRILFVGRFEEQRKGFKYLLRAMPLVRQQCPNARLVVVGTGKPEKFQDQMARYGVWGVDFVGYVTPEEKPRYYASCDIFCAPSIARESFGIVLLEAMASGKPVVAANIPGYASVLTNEQEGLLVTPRDPQAIALALVRALADAELRRRFAAKGLATAEQYAWARVAERVLLSYEKAQSQAVHASWRQDFE